VVLVIAGDFDEGRTMALIKQHYGGWKSGYQAPQVPSEPEQKKARRVAVEYDGRTLPLVATVWKGPRFDPSDREMVAGSLLGELTFGETSDLYRELVLDKRIAQRLMAAFDMSRDPGLWGAIAMVAGEQHLEAVEDAIVAAAARMREKPPSPERLDAVKRNFRYSFVMGMETPDDVAGGLARFVALTGGIEAVDAFFAVLDTVTPEDVQKAAQHFLTDQRRTVAVLTGVQR